MIRPTPRLFRHVESVEIISDETSDIGHTIGKPTVVVDFFAVDTPYQATGTAMGSNLRHSRLSRGS